MYSHVLLWLQSARPAARAAPPPPPTAYKMARFLPGRRTPLLAAAAGSRRNAHSSSSRNSPLVPSANHFKALSGLPLALTCCTGDCANLSERRSRMGGQVSGALGRSSSRAALVALHQRAFEFTSADVRVGLPSVPESLSPTRSI